MTRVRSFGCFFAFLLLAAAPLGLAPERPVTDTYDGTTVVDPYRYMEHADDPAFVAWRTTQLAATKTRLATLPDLARFDAYAKAHPAIHRPSSIALERDALFYERDGTDGRPEIVERRLDTNVEHVVTSASRFDQPGARASIGAFGPSPDSALVAIHVYVGDALDSELHIVSTATGNDAEPPLHHTIFDQIDFMPDGRSIIYTAAEGERTLKVIPDVTYERLHRFGTSQESDAIIFGGTTSPRVVIPKGAFAFVGIYEGSAHAVAEVRDVAAGGSRFYTAPVATLGKPDTPWRELGGPDSGYTDSGIHGDTIDLVTKRDAPNYRVVRGSLNGPFVPHDILPASDRTIVSGTLDGIPKAGIFTLNPASDAEYVQLLEGGVSRIVRIPYDSHATVHPVSLSLAGTILEVATNIHLPIAYLNVTSWTQPGDIYRYDPALGTPTRTNIVGSDPGATPREARELTAIAPDGTAVPVSVVANAGTSLDGSHPLLLQVVGAYGFSTTPTYDGVPAAWLALGGVYAVAHVRGGGELGESWHAAGVGAHKSNSWNDLIAAAQLLVSSGYTSPRKIGLYGTIQSYLGGIGPSIAIGRAIEERPELFSGAALDAPAFDMLRSETTPLGKQSFSEFGSTATKDGFDALYAMSPYEHIGTYKTYPRVLARSLQGLGIGDDWEAAKFVARWQAAAGSTDAASFDSIGASPDDRRGVAIIRRQAYAFLLWADANEAQP
jgi:prolyl oligopeptidase